MLYGNLLEDVKRLWLEHQSELERRICGWVKDIEDNRSFISRARSAFREWEPFMVYINFTKAKKGGSAVFSLRFNGQEVAQIKVNKNLEVQLRVEKETHAKRNSKYFGWKDKPFKAMWDSQEAKEFRDFFREIVKGGRKTKTHSEEHKVETSLIREMKTNPSGIQPVMFERCPFQMSTPIPGSTGKPKISKRGGGNMDIVARRRDRGSRIRISVWELKKPSISGSDIVKAMKQAIIYASTLRMMLRSRCGEDWYKLLGFNKSIPLHLKIEAVIALSSHDRSNCEKQIENIREELPLSIDEDSIIPCIAFYDDTYDIEDFMEIKE
jgi:hypothetical protein